MSKSKTGAEKLPALVNGWDGETNPSLLQRIAIKTNGWGTLANLVTVGGNATAGVGIEQVATGHYWTGALMFFFGKAGGDKLDGTVARATKTQSPKGEALDVGFDKVLAVGALATLLATGLYPSEAAYPKLAVQAGIVVAGAKANSRKGKEMGLTLHPGQAGKWNMGTTYTSIASFMATNAESVQHHPAVYDALRDGGGYGLTAVSIVLGTSAAVSYVRQTREQLAAIEANGPVAMPTPTDITFPQSNVREV